MARSAPDLDLTGDDVDSGHAVNPRDNPARFVARQDRRGLSAVFLHPHPHGFLVIVGPPFEFGAAAAVTHAGRCRRIGGIVIQRAAIAAGKPPGDAFDQGVTGNDIDTGVFVRKGSGGRRLGHGR